MKTLSITPLGAAHVEALPDQDKAKAVQMDFKLRKLCPVSAIFPTVQEVEEWYRQRGQTIKAIVPPTDGGTA